MKDLIEYLSNRTYPGRTIAAGMTEDNKLYMVYILQGRSENSRNRVLVNIDNTIHTFPKDESKVQNRDLVIYKALLEDDDYIYLTNGDQGESIKNCGDIEEGIKERTFENDPPIYTSRIGAIYSKKENVLKFFIIKKDLEQTKRIIWTYKLVPGYAHVIHTYEEDLSSFSSDPVLIKVTDSDLLNIFDNENTISCLVKVDDDIKIVNRGDL